LSDTILHDPIGRLIVLHDRTWHGHILKRHPELQGQRALVERAVTDPTEIRISA